MFQDSLILTQNLTVTSCSECRLFLMFKFKPHPPVCIQYFVIFLKNIYFYADIFPRTVFRKSSLNSVSSFETQVEELKFIASLSLKSQSQVHFWFPLREFCEHFPWKRAVAQWQCLRTRPGSTRFNSTLGGLGLRFGDKP